MINLNPSPADIANAAIRLQYDDITSLTELIDFARSLHHPTADPANAPAFRRAMIDMIDLDLNDMLHNNNLDFYLTLDELDTLTNDELDALADHLLDATDPELIADLLIAKFPA